MKFAQKISKLILFFCLLLLVEVLFKPVSSLITISLYGNSGYYSSVSLVIYRIIFVFIFCLSCVEFWCIFREMKRKRNGK